MILIFGDSHVGVMGSSYQPHNDDPPITFEAVNGVNWARVTATETENGVHASGDYLTSRALDLEVTKDQVLVFSSLLHTSPYIRDKSWQTHCPWPFRDLLRSHQPVSEAAILAWVDRLSAKRFAFIDMVRAKGMDLYMCEPPKPAAHTPRTLGYPAQMVRWIDQLARDHMTNALTKRGVKIISVPDETHKNGFTVKEYYRDTTHGSAAFGNLMVHTIVDRLRKDGQISFMGPIGGKPAGIAA